ncbi:MAG TPA: tetratricopeptide repeat protein [Candidatus Acidoferrum sp.]|nr:tetratricopeptide repeat protein [Candidatus Acidoferrum sp.]
MNKSLMAYSLLLAASFVSYSLPSQAGFWRAGQNPQAPSREEARAPARRGELEGAIQQYRQAIAKSPQDFKLNLEFAQFLAKARHFPDAIAVFRRALELAPRNETAESGLAEAYRRVHNVDETRALLQAARKHHPKSVSVLKAIGSFEIEAESFDAAIAALQAAVALAPKDVTTLNMLGTAYLGKGDKDAALAQIEKALALDSGDQHARFLRAQVFADNNKNEEALRDAEKVFEAKPDSQPARMLLAKILIRLKQCARAANILQPPGDAAALDTEALFLLGNAYDCEGKADLAKSARDEFAAASENERRRAENEVQSKHLYEKANELARQNKFNEALDLVQQALEKNPKNGFAYSQEAKIFFSINEKEKAQEAIGRALAIQPYQPDFLYVAGVIAEGDGKDEEALRTFEQVTQISPKEADAYFEMGRILMKRNDRVRALAAFRTASELEPDDPDYKRAVAEASVAEEKKN